MVSDVEGPAEPKQATGVRVCVCVRLLERKQVGKDSAYVCKNSHSCMVARYIIFHSQTSSCYPQEGLGGNRIKCSGLKKKTKKYENPQAVVLFLAASFTS